jgi:hypothetical protein
MAIATTAARTSLYLYAITAAPDRMATAARGVGGAPVEPIIEGGLAAMVSRLAGGKLRPQRSNLSAHHRVLHDLACREAVLPVIFGTIAAGEDELRELLHRNHDALLRLLVRLKGKVEMGLKVYWDFPNIFEYFVATHRELQAMRSRLFQPGRTPTLEEKVALGERFASLLEQSRQRHTRRVAEALAPYCVEIRSIDPGEERMITKLACLVQRDGQAQFEEGIQRAASLFDDHYRFDYNGPWPPYNFTDIDLRLA